MSCLTAEQIASLVSPTEVVTIDGFGSFKVRGLTAKETESMEGKKDIPTRLLLHGLVDDDGKRLFSDSQSTTVENIPQVIAEPLQMAVMRLSGLRVKGTDPQAEAEKK